MRSPHRRRRLRLAALLLLGGVLAGAGFWSVGLIRFAHTIPDDVVDDTTSADAIVVLTGGSERLATGLRLLVEHKGERVFISGVHPGVPVADLLRVAGIPSSAADSRIETGYGARDTAGNAEETAKWMRERGYRSLRLVTGNYHMPRSLLEFEHALPEAQVIPNPVFPHHVHQDAWWRNPGTAALIVTEYNKYLLAKVRHRLGLPTPAALRSALLACETIVCADPPRAADDLTAAEVTPGSARQPAHADDDVAPAPATGGANASLVAREALRTAARAPADGISDAPQDGLRSAHPAAVRSPVPAPANAGEPEQNHSAAAHPAQIGPWLRDVWLQALRAGAHWFGRC